MKYTLKMGYIRKLKLFVREKIKILDEAEINLETVDHSGMLHPRKINRNAQIVKRHRAIHEGNVRKNVIKKSQIKGPFGPTTPSTTTQEPLNDDILIPYKKVSFLPQYFYKVFIKKKKPEPAQEKPGARSKQAPNAKVDPKKPPGKPGDKSASSVDPDTTSTASKTKKLMEELKQEKEDYNVNAKIVVE